MSRYDVLCARGDANTNNFVVNVAVNEVPLTFGPIAYVEAVAAGGTKWFEPGDNLMLESIWPSLPYQFGKGTGQQFIRPVWLSPSNTVYSIPELESNGASIIYLPSACEPLNLVTGGNPSGLFVRVPADIEGGARLRLGLASSSLNISMLNVPPSLDGLELYADWYFAVRHTLPLGLFP